MTRKYVKALIDKTQEVWTLWKETIDHISERNKLVQKEDKSRHNWVGRGSTGNFASD